MQNRRDFIKSCSAVVLTPAACVDVLSKELERKDTAPSVEKDVYDVAPTRGMLDLSAVTSFDREYYLDMELKVPYHPAVGYYPFGLSDCSHNSRALLNYACRLARMARRYFSFDSIYTIEDSKHRLCRVTDCGMTCDQCLGKLWRMHYAPCRQLTCPAQSVPATSICNAIRCTSNVLTEMGSYRWFYVHTLLNIQAQGQDYL